VLYPAWRVDGNIRSLTNTDTPSFTTLDVTKQRVEQTSLTLAKRPTAAFTSGHRSWMFFAAIGDQTLSPITTYSYHQVPNPGQIWTYDTDTNTRIEPTIEVDSFVTASGSDNGDRVAVGTVTGIVVFDGNTGKVLHTYSDEHLRGANIVPGNRLVAVKLGGEMTVYDLDSFDPVSTLPGVRGFARVQGTADGSLAVAFGADRSIALFDMLSGQQIGDTIKIPDTEANAAAVRPDGKELAFGGGAGREFVVWDLDPQHWVSAACKVAGRNLTHEEWNTNIGNLAPYHRTCADYD
jgi:WD40 repeat protein